MNSHYKSRSIFFHQQIMKQTKKLPLKLQFQTQLFTCELQWVNRNLLKVNAIQKSQPQHSYQGQLDDSQQQNEDVIKSVFLHLQQIIELTQQTGTDYISPIVTILDTSAEVDKQAFHFKVRMFDRTYHQVFIPVAYKLRNPNAKPQQKIQQQLDDIQSWQLWQSQKELGLPSQQQLERIASLQNIQYYPEIQKVSFERRKKKIQKHMDKNAAAEHHRKQRRRLLNKKKFEARQVGRLSKKLEAVVEIK